MTEYNCQKRPYHAKSIQFNGAPDAMEIRDMFPDSDVKLGNGWIMLRHSPGDVYTLQLGDWAVRGENGKVKCYTDEQFKIKYEVL